MNKVSLMKENEFSPIGKISTIILVVILGSSAVFNIFRQSVPHPYAFLVVLIGFILFLAAKISNLKKKKLISFGTKEMSEKMSNLYRVGYWLMVVGLMLTFIE